MDAATAITALARSRLFRGMCALLLAACLATSAAWAQGAKQAAGEPAEITGIRLYKDGETLRIHFLLSRPTPYDVVANLPRQVVVVKFRNARPAFPDDQREFVFNDPYVVGIAFENVPDSGTWAKVRLRRGNLAFKASTATGPQAMVLALSPSAKPLTVELTQVRFGRQRDASRMVLELSALPHFEEHMQQDEYVVRLKGVAPRVQAPVHGEDARVALLGVEQDGPDTLVRVRLKQEGMRVNVSSLRQPARLVFNFRVAPAAVATAPKAAPAAAPPPRPRHVVRGQSLQELLDAEKSPPVRANYQLAEREFRAGHYNQAGELFRRVFDAAPQSPLGVRAYFRAADAQFQQAMLVHATNLHPVIITYKSAIRSAEEINYDSDLIPRAFFRIGRAYQIMGFTHESNVHYGILQERFPDDVPYTPDSYYYTGRNYLDQKAYDKALAAFQKFLASEGDPELQAPAHYYLGDAYFDLKRYVDAGTEYDQGRKLSPHYADTRPLLLFHMGETFYENADFQQARIFYRALLEHYPEKTYTKLVALRLGDFLRKEGKEAEALQVYRQVIKNAPLELALRGKMRVAGVLADRPVGDDYKQALKLYDEVIKEGGKRTIVQEAMLRKALALTLHGEHQAAIDTFAKLAAEHPHGPYSRDNLVKANIEENLKSLIDGFFARRKYWDVAKVYTRYKDQYFRDFRFKVTLFQVARSYEQLGLYDEAIGLYDEIGREHPGAIASLVDYEKALALLEKDDLGGAETALLKFIQAHKDDVYLTDARMLLGQVYFTARRYKDAMNAYRILIQDFEQSKDPSLGEAVSEAYYRLGQIYKELGQNQNALEAFRNAVANFHHPIEGPSVPDFVVRSTFLVGDMLFELGQDKEAIAAYELAIKRYPQHERAPWARYQIGLIYRRSGQDRKALDTFNALVDLAKTKPGELWGSLARQNQQDLASKLQFQNYLKQ